MKEEKFPKSRKPLTGRSVESLGSSEGNITRRKKKKKKNTEYAPNPNSQRKSSPDAHDRHQQAGAGQKARVACLG